MLPFGNIRVSPLSTAGWYLTPRYSGAPPHHVAWSKEGCRRGKRGEKYLSEAGREKTRSASAKRNEDSFKRGPTHTPGLYCWGALWRPLLASAHQGHWSFTGNHLQNMRCELATEILVRSAICDTLFERLIRAAGLLRDHQQNISELHFVSFDSRERLVNVKANK